MKEEILRMDNVTRVTQSGVQLDRFNLHLFKGEILGLLCMNDYGKDELVELIQRNLPLHYGFVHFDERLVNSYQKSSTARNRVAVIDQRSRLVENLTVADNIFVLKHDFKKYHINPRVLRDQFNRFTKDLLPSVSADDLVRELSSFERCAVELLKAVIGGAGLVVLRDLSNLISAADLVRFQDLMHRYAEEKLSFLYICSHHEEAFTICDRVMMMENGRVLLTMNRPFLSDEAIWRHSLDFSSLSSLGGKRQSAAPILQFCEVRTQNLHSLSLEVRSGECVTILDRNNTILADVVRLMNRESRPDGGQILVSGRPFCGKRGKETPEIGFIQQDPARTMIFPDLSPLDNLCFLADRKSWGFWCRRALRRSVALEYGPVLGVDIFEQEVHSLPMKTLYDLVYNRIHLCRPAAVFCSQPFLGADMYLRHHILSLIGRLRQRGIAVVLLSVNISDSLSIADRLLVVENGQLVQEYQRDGFSALSKQEGYDPHRTR